ncbi:MAG: hypothetical protein O2931_08025 [Planctomycetota bacterium]|nr:hypothetical protein [Planctomycetota bacterium]MDA1178728.1 hypothetical protein [Planctomycetota bacterium]
MSIFLTLLLPALITCYSLAFAIELRRQFAPGKLAERWTLTPLGIGWVLHTIYIAAELAQGVRDGTPLASWHQWWLLLAWGIGLASGLWILWRPRTVAGLFVLLPLLALVLIAWQLPSDVSFPVRTTSRVWIALHGVCLLLGTGAVLLGSVSGLMYLLQSELLRRKQATMVGLQLPNLEWLQRVTERCLLVSSLFVLAGLLVGVLANFYLRQDSLAGVPWSDPVVWTSVLLLVWLLSADLFSLLYRPARQGRKVAYLTVANLVFLGVVLAILLLSSTQHAQSFAIQPPAAWPGQLPNPETR